MIDSTPATDNLSDLEFLQSVESYMVTSMLVQKKGDKTRAEILGSAKKLYASRHFSAVTVTDVMRGTGHTRNSFYDYFDSLTDFIWIFLDEFHGEFMSREKPWYEGEHRIDLARRMVEQFAIVVEISTKQGWKLLTARQAAEVNKINAAIFEHFENECTENVKKNIERQQKLGAIRSTLDTDSVSKSIFKINTYAFTEMVRQDKCDVQYWTKIVSEIWLPVLYGVTWEQLFDQNVDFNCGTGKPSHGNGCVK